MTPKNASGYSSKKGPDKDLELDEDIEFDDDIEIDDAKIKTVGGNQYKEKPSTSKPTIVGLFLLVAFFLNLMSPITFIFLIYDVETSEGTTYLEGQIKDVDEDPVVNVTVNILDTNLTTVTNIDGKYKFNKAPVGTYKIQFTKAGYHKVTVQKVLFSRGLLDQLGYEANILDIPSRLQNSMYVEPFDGPHDVIMIINDNLNSTITGMITNQSGTPITGIYVDVMNTNLSSKTNNDGSYKLDNVPLGVNTILARSDTDEFVTNVKLLLATNKSLTLNFTYNDQQNQTIDLVSGKTGIINGTIVDAKGLSIENAKVKLNINPAIYTNSVIKSSENGNFKFDSVPIGIYSINIMANDYKIANITNITLITGQNASLPIVSLTKLKPVEAYQEDISGAYICTVILLILALITLFGAVSAFQRKRYSVAFIGAIVGMLPVVLPLRLDICIAGTLCLVSLILLVFSRSEFYFKKVK